jgi:hypothetical protein
MEEIKATLQQVSRAVFGNPDDPKKQPGILRELADVEAAVKITNATLSEMRGDQKKLLWIVVTAVVVAVLKMVIQG